VKTLNVHVERIVVEPRAGLPAGEAAIAAALRSALERELRDGPPPGQELHGAIERAVRAAFGCGERPESRSRHDRRVSTKGAR